MKTCVVLALFLMAGVSLADIQKRIKGGEKCKDQEEQHYVFLETSIETRHWRNTSICSGSVIGREETGYWVLTAAHCDAYSESFTVKSADRSTNQTVDHAQTFKHPTADVMLLKLSQRMENVTPIRLATVAECDALRDRLNKGKPETFRVTARDTQARAYYKKKKPPGPDESPDVTMCANITVDKLEPYNKALKHTKQVSLNECCRGEPSDPAGCETCKGDSGAGYIYNNALYAVHRGRDGRTLKHGGKLNPVNGFTVCDTEIREWINKKTGLPAV